MKFTVNNNEYELLFLTLAGSKLYGNSRPDSDTDYRGVFMAPNETFTGLLGTVEQLEGLDVCTALNDAGLDLELSEDTVLYELNRFCKLALDNNPNIMDMLCHDRTNPKFSLYCNDNGATLLDSKDLFMSTKLKHTFSGYAMAQLKRIKGHNKWIHGFPYTDTLLKYLKSMYDMKRVDFNWICDNFGGDVAEKITNETAQNNVKLKDTVNWETFISALNQGGVNYNKYRLPQLLDYCHPKTLKGMSLSMHDTVDDVTECVNMPKWTLKEHFLKHASFRTMSPSMLTVYTDGNGLFGKEGNLKANDPETVGDFVCLLSVDQNRYKSDKDHVKKMWQWKCNRNEKRGSLEEKFGYDTKHASHLVRLMEGCKDILSTGVYEPTLTGDRLKLVNDVRDGAWTYDELVSYAQKLDDELDHMYKSSPLKSKPDWKGVNKMVLELRK